MLSKIVRHTGKIVPHKNRVYDSPTIGIDVGNNSFSVSTMVGDEVRIICQYIRETTHGLDTYAGHCQLLYGQSRVAMNITEVRHRVYRTDNIIQHPNRRDDREERDVVEDVEDERGDVEDVEDERDDVEEERQDLNYQPAFEEHDQFIYEQNALIRHSLRGRRRYCEKQLPIYNWKRLMGKRFENHFARKDIENLSYKVNNIDGLPRIEINYFNIDIVQISPEQVMAIILNDIRIRCESYFHGTPMSGAVICIPASYNSAQRRATIDSAKMAGINVLQLIHNTTASSIAYRFNCGKKESIMRNPRPTLPTPPPPIPLRSNVLIFDLGGSSMDISVVSIDRTTSPHDTFRILSTSGDSNFGGEEFDRTLTEHFINYLRVKRNGVDSISKNSMLKHRLRIESRKSRQLLSQFYEDQLEFYPWLDYDTDVDGVQVDNPAYIPLMLKRTEMNQIYEELYRYIVKHLNRVMYDSQLDQTEIDDIVMVGGCSLQPSIRQILHGYFFGKLPNITMDVYTTSANGAAIQAASLVNKDKQNFGIVVQDIVSRSVMIECNNIRTKLFDQIDSLPASHSYEISISDSVLINVYESYDTNDTEETAEADDTNDVESLIDDERFQLVDQFVMSPIFINKEDQESSKTSDHSVNVVLEFQLNGSGIFEIDYNKRLIRLERCEFVEPIVTVKPLSDEELCEEAKFVDKFCNFYKSKYRNFDYRNVGNDNLMAEYSTGEKPKPNVMEYAKMF